MAVASTGKSPASGRIAGVLQRIAVCYFLAALVVMNTRVRGQAAVAGGLLVVYCARLPRVGYNPSHVPT
jgi:predicted acyltransferase